MISSCSFKIMFKKIEQQAANKAAQAHAPKKAKEEVNELTKAMV